MTRSLATSLSLVLLGLVLVGPGMAQAQDASPPELDSLSRSTPSGEYVDPASFFRFHGYATVSFTENQPEAGTDAGATPQILVNGPSARTGRNESGFRSDAALFIGGEPYERVGSVVEIHFVGSALDPVLTEAKFTYDAVSSENHRMTLVGGRFWWPFGIHSGEWFSSLNHFVTQSPAATEVVPAHYNEVGLMAEGVSRLGGAWGLNYVGAVGNGVPGFGLMPNVAETASDGDGDRTLTGRVGLARRAGAQVEVGLSAATGGLRQGEDPSYLASDPMRYGATFSAVGTDLTTRWRWLSVRAYYYRSVERLEAAPVSEIERDGYTIETTVRIPIDGGGRLQATSLHARVGGADEADLTGVTHRRVQLAGGVTFHMTRAFQAKIGYVARAESLAAPELSNDILSASFTVEF